MRRGLSLIELIFSMVIIAIAFTVFPKILQISSKSAKTSLKEEAMYNAVALMGLIKSLPWDEKNSEYDDILLTSGGESDYECSYDFGGESIYRRGGFVGSRNCLHKFYASSIDDDGDSLPDDIDDFDGKEIDTSDQGAFREYKLKVSVDYVKDAPLSSEELNGSIEPTLTTNSKYIKISIVPVKKVSELGAGFTPFWYLSYNIGQLRINKMAWKK